MAFVIASARALRHQRGVSVLESLVAFVVLAGSTVAVGHLHSQLRLAGDVARERSEAVRLAEAAMEDLRSFALVDDASVPRSYAAIGDTAATVNAGHASYRVESRVDAALVDGAKAASVTVRWNDRDGAARDIALHSFIAGIGPAYAGALGLAAGVVRGATRGVLGRAPALPVSALDLGNGRSAWKPDERGTTAVIFDNASGAIVGRCDAIAATTATRDLSAADLAACNAGRWLLVAGTVRFAAAALAAASDGTPHAALAIELGDGRYPTPPTCFSEARKTVRYVAAGSLHLDAVAVTATPASAGLPDWDDSGDRFIAWHCVVTPRADGRWSGRAHVVASGWTIGVGADDRRVCRYVHSGERIDA
ncbi:MAG TPA: hypothetical protein VII31_13730, partial [Caldimonas sp.]